MVWPSVQSTVTVRVCAKALDSDPTAINAMVAAQAIRRMVRLLPLQGWAHHERRVVRPVLSV
jgi:hypothetical protein